MPPYLDYSYSFEAIAPVLAPLDLMEKFQQKGEHILSELRQKVEAAGVPVETRMEEGVPGQSIADLAKEHDLVVLGKRGEHAKWGRDLLGSTAEAVTKRSTVPVLLTDEQARPFKKALVMFDGSEPAGRALRLAADLAARDSVELMILTANDDAEEGQAVLDEARAYLDPLGLAVTHAVLPGKPARAAAAASGRPPGRPGGHGHEGPLGAARPDLGPDGRAADALGAVACAAGAVTERTTAMDPDEQMVRVLTPGEATTVAAGELPPVLAGLSDEESPVTWIHTELTPAHHPGPRRHGPGRDRGQEPSRWS